MLYSRTATNGVVLLRVDGHERDFRLLLQDAELVDVLGMDLDANNIEQVATATQGVSSFSISVIRSLAGQDTGAVDPVPVLTLTGEDDTAEGQMLMADFNNDGFDDFVVSTPLASSGGLSENGTSRCATVLQAVCRRPPALFTRGRSTVLNSEAV